MDAGGVSGQVFSETLWEENAMESLEEQIAAAGRTVADDTGVRAALAELVGAHGSARRKRRRAAWLGVGIGGALALAGCAAVVALQPWFEMSADRLVISQEWHDASGVFLGSCETVWDLSALTPDAQAFVEERLRDRDPSDYGIDAASVPDKPEGRLSRTPLRTAELLQGRFNAVVIADALEALRASTKHRAADLTGESSCSPDRRPR